MTKRIITQYSLLSCMLAFCSLNCGVAKEHATPSRIQISGTVSDSTTQAALSNVTVSALAGTTTATTDASGNFSLVIEANDTDVVVLKAQNANYAPQYARVASDASMNPNGTNILNKSVLFALRPVDKLVEIALPKGSDPAVSVDVEGADAKSTLSIPADSLVLENGAIAQGNVTVALTYWHPYEERADIPAALAALNPNDNTQVSLRTWGMTDIQITQDDQTLQVATGKTLALSWQLAQLDANSLVGVDITDSWIPSLWFLDTHQALWIQQGNVKSQALSYDGNTHTFVAQLPHLSTWNLDNIRTPTGCLQGSVVTDKNRPVTLSEMKLWYAGINYIAGWDTALMAYDFTTDASGNFCLNTIGTSTSGWDNANKTYYLQGGLPTEPYFISFHDPKDSACNPLNFDYLSSCQNAQNDICFTDAKYWLKTFNKTASGANKCQLKTATIASCHVCAGTAIDPNEKCRIPPEHDGGEGTNVSLISGGCTDLGSIVVPTPKVCPTNDGSQGQACTTDLCCQKGLVCLDYLCVPPSDPTVISN